MAHLLMIEGWVSESGNLILPLMKKLGHTYTFVTRNPEHYKAEKGGIHPLFESAIDVVEADTNDIPELLQRVRDLKFDGVITVCDYYFEAVCAVAGAFGLPCPLPSNLQNIRQKHLMRKLLDRSGLPNAKFRLASAWEDVLNSAGEVGYPLIVKPVDLGSSAFVRLIHNDMELRESFNALCDFPLNFRGQERNHIILLEEFLRGEEVSVECVVYRGEISVIGVTDKSLVGEPYFIENGHMFPAKLDSKVYDEATTYVKRVLEAMEFDNGISHTEIKLTADGPRIVEINPRTPGGFITELIERVTGISLLKVFIQLALGEDPDLQEKETGVKSAAVQFLTPPHGGVISEICGLDILKADRYLVRYSVPNYKRQVVSTPVDNACYVGHVIAVDPNGQEARRYAERAANHIEMIFEE